MCIRDSIYYAADEYLSGNVRQKLAAAKVAAQSDPALQVNVDALQMCIRDSRKVMWGSKSILVLQRHEGRAVVNPLFSMTDTLLPVSYTHLDVYKRQIQMYSDVVMELGKSFFEERIDAMKERKGVKQDVELDANDLKELCLLYTSGHDAERPVKCLGKRGVDQRPPCPGNAK